MSYTRDYYLGATTPCGFADFFRLLADDPSLRLYIVKSGPGCGKSSLMRRVSERVAACGCSLEYIHCSSDPCSLDGVVCRALGFAIIDGTAPHGRSA
ncbi:MAG: hypothetical protein RR998_04505 [Oscillospiraceae bacterium]